MMALTDILAARAQSARATASVDCGALGCVTVEALPLRELERFGRDTDGDRGLFYAACRELQQAGNQLMQAGKLVRPDGILAFVSADEAAQAAAAVRELSGLSGKRDGSPREPSGEMPEFQLAAVQENPAEERGDSSGAEEIRLAPVREIGTELPQVRPETVQDNPTDGQVSREFLGQSSEMAAKSVETVKRAENVPASGKKAQDMDLERASDVDSQEVSILSQGESGAGSLHETKPEMRGALRESKSESAEELNISMHEAVSETGEAMREATSGFSWSLRETGAEQQESLHETTSENGKNERFFLHETESESAERMARALLEGLRQAAWVR